MAQKNTFCRKSEIGSDDKCDRLLLIFQPKLGANNAKRTDDGNDNKIENLLNANVLH